MKGIKLDVNNFGFTLVELMIVVSIIGILAGLSVFGMQNARESARDARRKGDLESIRSALELYKADCNYYPPSMPAAGSQFTGGACNSNVYMEEVPDDPISNQDYYFNPSGSPATTYILCAALETYTSLNSTCGSNNCGTGGECSYLIRNP